MLSTFFFNVTKPFDCCKKTNLRKLLKKFFKMSKQNETAHIWCLNEHQSCENSYKNDLKKKCLYATITFEQNWMKSNWFDFEHSEIISNNYWYFRFFHLTFNTQGMGDVQYHASTFEKSNKIAAQNVSYRDEIDDCCYSKKSSQIDQILRCHCRRDEFVLQRCYWFEFVRQVELLSRK